MFQAVADLSPVERTAYLDAHCDDAELRDEIDPETDLRYTVKRYRSEKTADEDGWRHVRIVLEPTNHEFSPIVLTTEDEEAVAVVAEFVEVLGTDSPSDGL